MSTTEKDIMQGIISGWDKISALDSENIFQDFGESKDVHMILRLIHYLQVQANSDNPLRALFEDHVNDKTNPHEYTIGINEIDLFNVLFDEFTAQYGAIMTLAEFITALIQVKRFATRDDVDNLTNLLDAVNLDVLAYAIDEHDNDLNAHDELIRSRFPGTPIENPPAIAIIPNILSSSTINVQRASSINVHDIDGRVREVGVNEIAVDYAYGVPSLPIFGATTNFILNSRIPIFMHTPGMSNLPVSNYPSLFTPSDDHEFALIGVEPVIVAGTNVPAPRYKLRSIDTIPAGEVRTLSFYVFQLGSPFIQMRLGGSTSSASGTTVLDDVVAEATFDLNEQTALSEMFSAIEGVVSTELLKLPNGWIRLSVTLKTVVEDVNYLEIGFGDETGAFTYLVNNTETVAALWQLQLVDKASAAPPIFTDSNIVTLAETRISKPVTDQWNQYSGTVSVKAIVPVSELYHVQFELATFRNDDGIFIDIGSDEFDTSKLRMTTTNAQGEFFTDIYSEPYAALDPKLVKQAVLGYTYGHQSYGFTANRPHVFDHYGLTENGPKVVTNLEFDAMVMNYFINVAGEAPFTREGASFLQLPTSPDDPVDSVLPPVSNPGDTNADHLMPDQCTSIDIGYNSDSGNFLNGYLLEFIYYPVFAEPMNIEFLCDEYITE